ncbi:DUF484 family protein [Dasania sp. GY-MA-18]|uniref:DUF484 family protein n=1 Tax=Dasania phycosphaerae TaxID=2950436 RepID=A0A9J6RLS2_9GAMM|nr:MULTISPECIES: DUF484 family protein [Dasania]MCR8922513.1 DUF484 family protein [Dasania sp. GY-MA-18]MCZ0864941.1 DUF484 family protein [Dasania phycosphaerae]MCZ0868669.1 DUF484 family protein [Dasania phycosphaerae]
MSNHNNDIEVTEEQVALYLKNHPGFFLKRDDLLCEIELAHSSGEAVSLLERQVSLLRERNMDIRNRLNSLLDNARNNDRLFEKTKAIVLALLEAKSLDSIVNTFTRGLKNEFAMDFASLILFADPQSQRNSASRIVPLDDAFHAIPGLLKSNKATCGVLRPEELSFLFPNQHKEVGSAAVVPLSFGHSLGVIAIGSKDAHYFRSSMGTLFLGYIAEVLNRILPRYLSLG